MPADFDKSHQIAVVELLRASREASKNDIALARIFMDGMKSIELSMGNRRIDKPAHLAEYQAQAEKALEWSTAELEAACLALVESKVAVNAASFEERLISKLAKQAADPSVAPVVRTEHSHWSHYDENLEMLEFDRLALMARTGERFEAADASRLLQLAYSSGYGTADSFIHDFGMDGAEDTDEQAAHREAFENYQESDYFSCIDRSQSLLLKSVGDSEERRRACDAVCDGMRDAYERGRDERIAMEAAPAASPGA